MPRSPRRGGCTLEKKTAWPDGLCRELLPARAWRGTLITDSRFTVLTVQSLEPDHITETIQARMPTPEEADELELPAGEPVAVLHRTTFAADDVPVEFARGVHAASRFAWTYSFRKPGPARAAVEP